MNAEESSTDDILIAPANEMLAAASQKKSDDRAQCKWAVGTMTTVLIIGVVIGRAGEQKLGHRTPRLTLEQHVAYGGVTASLNPAVDPCSNFKAVAGTTVLPDPSPETLSGTAALFYAEALDLPRGSTYVPVAETGPAPALRDGLSVDGIRVQRRLVSDGGGLSRPVVVSGAEPGATHLDRKSVV